MIDQSIYNIYMGIFHFYIHIQHVHVPVGSVVYTQLAELFHGWEGRGGSI